MVEIVIWNYFFSSPLKKTSAVCQNSALKRISGLGPESSLGVVFRRGD
jgi:hypothetical protein